MQQTTPLCSRFVVEGLQCSVCGGLCNKHGKTANLKQRYKCKMCNKTFIDNYTYHAYKIATDEWITNLVKEGCGIRSIARLLSISNTTVLKRILLIAKSITKPIIAMNKSYEVDEMRTYYKKKNKLLWVVYALQKDNGQVAEFAVGSRTKKTLSKVTDTLLLSNATMIYTDKLNLYSYIIPSVIHSTCHHGTNHIERKNLSLRTHLKRLNRRTICFTKSIAVLVACLKIYFWATF
jgi:IS1 family transposase/transposase-like protein